MNLATEPTDTRRAAIAGERRSLLPILIEKDFWVCWTLERLFALPELREHLLFKGGASLSKVYGLIQLSKVYGLIQLSKVYGLIQLSKVYGLIQRFSEDIDLFLSRSALGADLADPEQAASNTQRKQLSAALVAAFQETVTHRLSPRCWSSAGRAKRMPFWSWTQTGSPERPSIIS